MSELTDLYQELILDHNRSPRNFRRLEPCAHRADGHNPLCGDRVTVFLDVKDGRVADAAFQGSGCAISTASSSLMTESVKGRPVAEVRALFERMHALLTAEPDRADGLAEGLGKLAAFAGVSRFPMRVKCASLAWHTLLAALDHQSETVRTEEDA
jgi:nitrogen fixation protein NifU and related proteins